MSNPYPFPRNNNGAPFHAQNNAAAAAVNTVTMAAIPGMTAYITEIHVHAGFAAAVIEAVVTITGALGGTITRHVTETAAGGAEYRWAWANGLPASGPNVALVVSLAALAGTSLSDIDVNGFYQ